MTSEQNRNGAHADRPRPTRAQQITAWGFLGAFGLTIITVLLTGLWVRAPRPRAGAEPPPPAAVVERNTRVDSAAPAAQATDPSERDTRTERESGRRRGRAALGLERESANARERPTAANAPRNAS